MISFDEQRLIEDHIVNACVRNGWRVVSIRTREYVDRRPVDSLDFEITVGADTVLYQSVFVGLGIRNRLRWQEGPRIAEVDELIEAWNKLSINAPCGARS